VSNTVAGVDMRGFATRLRHAREAAALSQRALAAQAGVNLGNYNELEQAQRTGLRVETLLRVCQVLGVSADSLLGLTDDPRPRPRRKRPAQADAGEPEGAAYILGKRARVSVEYMLNRGSEEEGYTQDIYPRERRQYSILLQDAPGWTPPTWTA
jgi:transcriptional regulator with XRE-family HTH domain